MQKLTALGAKKTIALSLGLNPQAISSRAQEANSRGIQRSKTDIIFFDSRKAFNQERRRMKDVLFVCQANVGRSQMAEGFYNSHTNSHNAISAGAEDYAQKYNFRPTPEMVAVMAEKGIDISEQRIKLLTPEMCDEANKIIVLCSISFCPMFLLLNRKVIFREITDPFKRDVDTIRQVRDEIESLVKEII